MPTDWLPIAGFWLLLLALFAAELAWPMRRGQAEGGGRLVTNFGLAAINVLLLSLLPLSAVIAAQWSRATGFGLLPRLGVGGVAAIVLTLAARSLAGYALHRAAHRWQLLWRVHKVHHCDAAVDLTTGLRHHPLELLYVASLVALLAAGLGLSPEAVAVYEAAAVGFSLWSHANAGLPPALDRALRLLVVTPAAHSVHHSAAQVETDSNYGEVFTFWDRLFGTYNRMSPAQAATLRCGLGDAEDASAGRLHVQLCAPLLVARHRQMPKV